MARIRSIKPEFWADEKLSPLDPITRLVFLGLISMADDAGRLVDNVKQIDALVFPETSDSARESLATLSRIGRIQRGKTHSGQSIIQIANWSKHQRVDHPNMLAALPEIVATSEVTEIREGLANDSREIPESLASGSRLDLRSTTNDLRPTTNDQGPAITSPPTSAAADPVGLWNTITLGTPLPKAKLITKRQRLIARRLKEPGWLDDFTVACQFVRDSPFHCGKNDRRWRASIDYILQDGKASELAELARAPAISPRIGQEGSKAPAYRAGAESHHNGLLEAIEAKGGQDPYGKNRELIGDDYEAVFDVPQRLHDDSTCRA